MGNQFTVLVVSQDPRDHEVLSRILGDEYTVAKAMSLAEAEQQLSNAAVVICEQELPGGGWKELLQQIRKGTGNRPKLVVTSQMADEFLWAAVLNEGGWECLAKPFDAAEVNKIVMLAYLASAGPAEARAASAAAAARAK